jgi:Tfp pilus assembly protein PilX
MHRSSEQGAVLLVVMLVMLALLGLGMSGLFLTQTNIQVINNNNLRNSALYVAEAGLERAADILNSPITPDFSTLLGGPGHVAIPEDEIPNSLDPATGQPIGRGAILLDLSGTVLSQVSYPTSVSHAEAVPGNSIGQRNPLMGMYTVYIRNDTAECRMGRYTVDDSASGGNQVVVIRSEGTAIDGRTTVVLEMTMGPGNGANTTEGGGGIAAVLCNAGKNACDDNNSVQNNVVVDY